MKRRPGDERRLRRSWLQRMVIVGNCLLVVSCVAAAAVLQFAWVQARSVNRVALGTTLDDGLSTGSNGPENYLIVGVDSAEGLASDEALKGRPPGLRSDTMMVLRVDPANARAQLLSIPRDLYVKIAGGPSRDKINSAIGLGRDRLIQTIKENLGIPINHYVQVDFAGFEAMVAAVDGIKLNFLNPTRDRKSFLAETGPGCVSLDPKAALAVARSRHTEVQVNGKWREDPTADLGRIERQQELIRVIIQRAIDKGVKDPRVLNDLVSSSLKAITIDDRLTVRQIVDLGAKFRTFVGDNLVTYRIPVADQRIGGQDVLVMQQNAVQPLLDLFRDVPAPPNDPRNTLVALHNGTGGADQAADVAEDLRSRGFDIPSNFTGDADSFDVAKTVVTFSPGNEGKGRLVARYVRGPVRLQEGLLFGADVDVLIGADWTGVADQPKAESELPAGKASTTTSTTSPASSAGVAPTTTLPPPSTVAENRLVYVPQGC